MEDKNLAYLQKQVFFAGMSESLFEPLRAQLELQQNNFTLQHATKIGNDDVHANLHFSKSVQSGMYFFNRFDLAIAGAEGKAQKQSFYISQWGANFTLKEGYNMMQGRAVYKENLVFKKDGASKTYNAWNQLDKTDADQHGNLKIIRFNDRYGFNLEQLLASDKMQHLFKECREHESRLILAESIKRGNQQMATFIHPETGNQLKYWLEANPRMRNLTVYDSSQQVVQLKTQKEQVQQAQGKQEKQGQDQSEQKDVHRKQQRRNRIK